MPTTTVETGQVWSKDGVNFTVIEIVEKTNSSKVVVFTRENGKKLSALLKYFTKSFTKQ